MDKDDPRRQPSDEELDDLNEHWEEPGDPDGVVAEEERQKWRAEHPAPPVVYKKKRRWLRALIVLVLLVAATFGAYWFGDHEASAPSSQPAVSSKTTPEPATKKPATTPTKRYESISFSLALNYPDSWRVTDNAAKLTVASPSVQLTMPGGTKTGGHVLLTVLHKQTSVAGYPTNDAVAVLASQKLTYAQPTTVQRAQTYISFLSYKQADGLDAVYVTGDYGYLQHQAVPESDIAVSDPLIGVSFVRCSTADCASGTVTPLTLLASSWQKAPFSGQVMKLLESIQFQ